MGSRDTAKARILRRRDKEIGTEEENTESRVYLYLYNTTNDHVSKKPAFPGNKEVVSSIFSRKQISSNRSVATTRNPYNVYRAGGGKKVKISRSFCEVRNFFFDN